MNDPGRKGSKAKQVRDKKGNLTTVKKSDFGGITDQDLRDSRKSASKGGNSYFSGGPAPMTGGTFKGTGMASGTAKKASVKKAIKNIKKTAASPQAKKAARRTYK